MAKTPIYGWDIPDPSLAIHPQLRDVLLEIELTIAGLWLTSSPVTDESGVTLTTEAATDILTE